MNASGQSVAINCLLMKCSWYGQSGYFSQFDWRREDEHIYSRGKSVFFGIVQQTMDGICSASIYMELNSSYVVVACSAVNGGWCVSAVALDNARLLVIRANSTSVSFSNAKKCIDSLHAQLVRCIRIHSYRLSVVRSNRRRYKEWMAFNCIGSLHCGCQRTTKVNRMVL